MGILPVFGQELACCRPLWQSATVAGELPEDLVDHLARSTDLPAATVERVVADVVAYFGETVEQYVRRRHRELHARGRRNDDIWPVLLAELPGRRYRAASLTERQLRRIVYG